MTIFGTIFAGVIIFVSGQIFIRLFIEPVSDLKRTIAHIAYVIIKYADVYRNPGTNEVNESEVSKEFRNLSSRVNAQMYLVPGYDVCRHLFGLPKKKNISRAMRLLIGLSITVYKSTRGVEILNAKKADEICALLGIYVADRRPAAINENSE